MVKRVDTSTFNDSLYTLELSRLKNHRRFCANNFHVYPLHDPVLEGLSSTRLIRGTMTTYRKQNNWPANVSCSIRDAGHFVIPAFVFPSTPFSNREFNLRGINGCSLFTRGAQCAEIRRRNLFLPNDYFEIKRESGHFDSRTRSFVFRMPGDRGEEVIFLSVWVK